MHPLEQLVNFFLPIRDNEIDRFTLWNNHLKYMIRSGIPAGLLIYLHAFVLAGIASSLALGLAVLFTPTAMACLYISLFKLGGFNPYR